MKTYIQVVTVPTADTPSTCLMLHYDHRRYLLGQIGEGTMRACNELGLSLRKVQKIFVTGRVERETTGGLLGMLLTLADANSAAASNAVVERSTKKGKGDNQSREENVGSDVNVYGPRNLVHSIAAARKFIFRKSTPTTIRDLGPLSDEAILREGEIVPRIQDDTVDIFPLVARPQLPNMSYESKMEQFTPTEGLNDDDTARQRIINDMFNSKWRLDTLVEKYLHEVQLPAKIWYRDPDTKDLREYTGPLPPDPKASKTLKVFIRNPWPAATAPALPPTTQISDGLSYIVRGKVTRGKFDAQRAKALGLKPGPLFAKLANGQNVTLEDGTVIQPSQVLGPDVRAGGFAILDVPSIEYVDRLTSCQEWWDKKVLDGVEVFVWLLGAGVSSSPLLQKFIETYPHVQHIISSPDHNTNQLVAHGAASSAIKLAQVDKDHFPVPYFDNNTIPAPHFRREAGIWAKDIESQTKLFELPNVMLAQRGLTVHLNPQRKVEEKDIIPRLDTLELTTMEQLGDVMVSANEVRQSAVDGPLATELKEWHETVPHKDVEIITLGTGSAMPSKYRNVSANLVRVPGWGSYLLDAGENTLGQLQRVYKPHELVEVLRDLRMIWISHGHADHHLGTVSVIKAWYDVVHGKDTQYPPWTMENLQQLMADSRSHPALQPPALHQRPKYLAIMGNSFLFDYLYEISQVEDFGFSHVMPINFLVTGNGYDAPLHKLSVSFRTSKSEGFPWMLQDLRASHLPGLLGISSAVATPVRHCRGSRAICLRFPAPPGKEAQAFSVAYSGDCRPSAKFAEHARGATVLIHEATFDDELKGEAVAKKHSTVQEAISIARMMQAKSLVLTHFSQRYQKIPVLENVWGKAASVENDIVKEDVEESAGVKNSGSAEEVDEIADDVDDVATAAATAEDVDMDVDEAPVIPVVSTPKDSDREIPILFAFDYMRARVGDMPLMREYRPALTKLFETEIEELAERQAKRAENAAMEAAGLKRSGSMRSMTSQPSKKDKAKSQGESPGKKIKSNPAMNERGGKKDRGGDKNERQTENSDEKKAASGRQDAEVGSKSAHPNKVKPDSFADLPHEL